MLHELFWEFKEAGDQEDRSLFKQHFAEAIDAALVADGVTQTYLRLSGRDLTASNAD